MNYGMRALLVLYMVKYLLLPGHYDVQGAVRVALHRAIKGLASLYRKGSQ